MGEYFKVKKITNVDDLKVGDVVPTSDFASMTPKGNFLQLEYVEGELERETWHLVYSKNHQRSFITSYIFRK